MFCLLPLKGLRGATLTADCLELGCGGKFPEFLCLDRTSQCIRRQSVEICSAGCWAVDDEKAMNPESFDD